MVRKKNLYVRRTTIIQPIPKELRQKVSSYITQIRHLRKTRKYSARNIAVTGLWLDMLGRKTLD